MQSPRLAIEEVVYEITTDCHHTCSYCSSKRFKECLDDIDISEKIEYRVTTIIESIMTANPKSVVITGGNPLLVNFNIHHKLNQIVKMHDTKLSIVISAKDLATMGYASEKDKIISLYDSIEISVNDSNDKALFDEYIKQSLTHRDKTVIATNINTGNIFKLDSIAESIKRAGIPWHLQLTMYKDEANESEKINGESLKYLALKLRAYREDNLNIVYGDNMVSRGCSAGLQSCSVRAGGEVIGCLSSYLWSDYPLTYGNIYTGSLNLQQLWQICFHTERFTEHKCCKDICGNIDIEALIDNKYGEDCKKKIRRQSPAIRDSQMTFPPQATPPPEDNHPYIPIPLAYDPTLFRRGFGDSLYSGGAVFNSRTPVTENTVDQTSNAVNHNELEAALLRELLEQTIGGSNQEASVP